MSKCFKRLLKHLPNPFKPVQVHECIEISKMQSKKLALVIHSLEALLDPTGIKGGGDRVNLELLNHLLQRPDIELKLITTQSNQKAYKSCRDIFYFDGSIYTDTASVLSQIQAHHLKHPDYTLLFSDFMAPFGHLLIQSHSVRHRRNRDSPLFRPFTLYQNRHKLKKQALALEGEPRLLITVSKALKADYLSNFPLKAPQIKVAYPGVEQSEVLSNKAFASIPVIGLVGGGSLNKSLWLFLLAILLLRLKTKSFRVLMIYAPKRPKANDQFIPSLLKLLRLAFWIEILPFQADMTHFYTSLDFLVVSSLNEAFGLVVLEALSQGVIPIVSSTAGAAELIEDGVNGFQFNRLKQPLFSLMNTLETAITLDAYAMSRLRDNAFNTAKDYSWQRFTDTVVTHLFSKDESVS
ncbi:MAG: glycosyltransferase family 4 protein [Vampirovibrio sp.]